MQTKDLHKGLERVLELLLERVGLQHIDDTEIKDVALRALNTVPVLAQHRHRRPSTNTAVGLSEVVSRPLESHQQLSSDTPVHQ